MESQNQEIADISSVILSYLRKRKGERLAESQRQICQWLGERDIKVSARSFRLSINYLRNKLEEPIMSNQSGYYYAESEEELEAFIKRLEGRIASQTETLESLKNIKNKWRERNEL